MASVRELSDGSLEITLCIICGENEKYERFHWCIICKKDVEALTYAESQKPKKFLKEHPEDKKTLLELEKSLNDFKEHKKKRDDIFVQMVQAYQAACESKGQGIFRGSFDSMQFMESLTTSTEGEIGFKLQFFNHKGWMKHATNTQMKTPRQAQDEWQQRDLEAKEHERKGKADTESYQLAMHVEDFIIGRNKVAEKKLPSRKTRTSNLQDMSLLPLSAK